MKRLLIIPVLLSLCITTTAKADLGDVSITSTFKGQTAMLSTDSEYAGAVTSLVWDSTEYILSIMEGLQAQFTVSFDGHGGCYQAVEAGGIDDDSILLTADSTSTMIETTVTPAFWMAPETEPVFPKCGQMSRSEWDHEYSVNTTTHWTGTMRKKVTMNYKGMGNVIEYMSFYYIPQVYDSALFVPLTIYTPGSFSEFLEINFDDYSVTDIGEGDGYAEGYNGEDYDPVTDQFVDNPVILSTSDEEHALTIYSPDVYDRWEGPWFGDWDYGQMPMGYGRWSASTFASKVATFFRAGETNPGWYGFRHYIVFGSLQDVIETTGYLAYTERPTITRAIAARMINLAFGRDYTPSGQTFLDVDTDNPFYLDIELFNYESVTTGCGYSMFCPDRYLTRAAAVTYLLRKLGYSQSSAAQVYDDVPSSYPLFGWVQKAYELGWTWECAEDMFCPNDPVTIEDLQEFIWRAR